MTAETAKDKAESPAARLQAVLAEVAAEHYGDGTRIDGLVRLSGGASRGTWSFDAVTPDGGREPLILKRDPADQTGEQTYAGVDSRHGVDRWTEGRLVELAGEAGVPEPRVPFYLAADGRTTAGFVMQRVEGETLGRRILREEAYAEARPKLAFQCGQAAARLHGIPAGRLPPLSIMDVGGALAHQRGILDNLDHAHAGFEYGLRWLEERLELAGDRQTLVHGDFRNGNIIVGGDGLRAVLDWESSHIGNPFSDLGWICIRSWRYGHFKKPVGGFGEIEDMLEGYEAGGGGRVDPRAVHFWEVFGSLRWGVICVMMAFTHIIGPQRSVEKAAIGRRAAETEHDLLQLVD